MRCLAAIAVIAATWGSSACSRASNESTSKSTAVSKAPSNREDLVADIRAENLKVRHRFRACARLVGDAYRTLGKPNHRVTLVARLRVHASHGKGTIDVDSIDAPADVPKSAVDCYVPFTLREHTRSVIRGWS